MKTVFVLYPNNKIKKYLYSDFELFGDELEHKTDNIILNVVDPKRSFAYLTDFRGEISHLEPIKYRIV
jgi:hypothetical protein